MAATLAIKGAAPQTGYDRSQFGPDWTDNVAVNGGHNGCDTRNDILRRDLYPYQIMANTNGCVVASGTLNDPYSGKVIEFVRGTTTSSAVQIDHVVALSDAWQKGAQQLTLAQRTELANDPLELLAVDGPTNAPKRDSHAATWLPPNKSFRCTMVSIQVNVKAKYGLWVTPAERDAIDTVLNTCPGQPLPTHTNVPPPG